jgi:predicted nucleic acid-binding protein
VNGVLLDTTVVSAMRRPESSPAVRSWLLRQSVAELAISSITEMELLAGVMKKENQDPRQGLVLRAWFDRVMDQFSGRVVPFDSAAARWAASIGLIRTRGLADVQVAATALAHGLALATLNREDFEDIPALALVDLTA